VGKIRRGRGGARERTKLRARIDLDAVIFDGDRDMRAQLRRDPAIKKALKEMRPGEKLAALRRELLLSSLKLTPAIAPELYEAVERVRKALGLDAAIEAYCFSSPDMNAFVAPPDGNAVLVGVSSPLLEKMDVDEVTFVLGHEIGHVLFEHFRMAPSILLESEERLPPLQITRLFAWMRYAELSADRMGLICCRDVDAAIRAFFKLTSGLCDARFLKNAKEAAAQLDDLTAESTEADWFSTHPYGPLRIKAIQAFSQSATYHSIIGKVGGDLSESELEAQVSRIMRFMDPCFTDGTAECHPEIKEMLVLGGLTIALADGTLDRSEEQELERMLGAEIRISDESLEQLREGAADERLAELGHHLAMRLSSHRRKKILEDLVAIALADERLADTEIDALCRCADLLEIDRRFVEESLGRLARSLD
jgi:uncharacterized tellurite resistance protein B-like protein